MEPLLEEPNETDNIHDLVRRIHADATETANRRGSLIYTDIFYDMIPFPQRNGPTVWWVPTEHPISILLYDFSDFNYLQHISKDSGSVLVWSDDALAHIVEFIKTICENLGLAIQPVNEIDLVIKDN